MALGHKRKASSIAELPKSKRVSLSSPKTAGSKISKHKPSASRSTPTKPKLASSVSFNEPAHLPHTVMSMFSWGTGSMCELGLGPEANCKVVKRPRLNQHLSPEKACIVDFAVGGMHTAALTRDGRVLTWGVNDQGALGRETQWSGGEVDIDEDDMDEDEQTLNPRESTPDYVEGLPSNEKLVKVACADSLTLAISERGYVYAWGTFRSAEGILGFSEDIQVVRRPTRLTNVSDIMSLATGTDHVLALSTSGRLFAWGNGQQYQLGRKVMERRKLNGLTPREFGLKNIKRIGAGSYHSFAIDSQDQVWSWGLNQFGQCGVPSMGGEDGAVVPGPTIVKSLSGLNIIQIEGGEHHSCAITASGDLYVWGRLDISELGVDMKNLPETVVRDESGKPRFIPEPYKLPNIGPVASIAVGSHHNIAILKSDGSLWSWGFGESYQTGQGPPGEDIEVPTKIENTATRDVKMLRVGAGGQFSVAGGLLPNQMTMMNGFA